MSVPFIQQGPSGKAFPEGLHTQHLILSHELSAHLQMYWLYLGCYLASFKVPGKMAQSAEERKW